MKIEITRDGKTAAVDVAIDVSSLTARETERIEEAVPDEAQRVPSTKMMRALIWAKLLKTPFSDVGFDEIDFDMTELEAFAETPEENAWFADGESVVIPMETTTGTVEAEVNIG